MALFDTCGESDGLLLTLRLSTETEVVLESFGDSSGGASSSHLERFLFFTLPSSSFFDAFLASKARFCAAAMASCAFFLA